jgi:hypothetical protein
MAAVVEAWRGGFPSSLAINVLSPVGQLVLRRREGRIWTGYQPGCILTHLSKFSNWQTSVLIYNRGSQIFIRKVKPPVPSGFSTTRSCWFLDSRLSTWVYTHLPAGSRFFKTQSWVYNRGTPIFVKRKSNRQFCKGFPLNGTGGSLILEPLKNRLWQFLSRVLSEWESSVSVSLFQVSSEGRVFPAWEKKKNPKYWIDSRLCEGICVGRSSGETRTDALSQPTSWRWAADPRSSKRWVGLVECVNGKSIYDWSLVS